MGENLYYYKTVFFPEGEEDCRYFCKNTGIAGFKYPKKDRVLLCYGKDDSLRAYLKNNFPKRAVRRSMY